MPTVFRFLVSLALIAAVFAAIVFSLGNLVEPNTRTLTIRLPPGRLDPKHVAPPPAPPPAVAVEAGTGDADGGAGAGGPAE
jgi:hypothetical protein